MGTQRSERVVQQTDNSVYQLTPALVVAPIDTEDTAVLVRANAGLAKPLALVGRGGATGTNGQSLTDQVVVDFSRHMNHVLELGPVGRVQPGVVLDELNRRLALGGRFFAPHVSTSNRATIGGMVATDAAGKGSRIHGRTHRHVRRLTGVLADGTVARFQRMPRTEATRRAAIDDALGILTRQLLAIEQQYESAARATFPKLPRPVTGYGLGESWSDPDQFDPIALLCGSEGTLFLVTEIELTTEPLPSHQALAVLTYRSLEEALSDQPRLMLEDPYAVELIDERVLRAVPVEEIDGLGTSFQLPADAKMSLFVELRGHAPIANAFCRALTNGGPALTSTVTTDPIAIAKLWKLRKAAVGLASRSTTARRAIPFVEDCAVPPDRLAAFLSALTALLEENGLRYGIYGHADVGCVHVRPGLDLTQDSDRERFRSISDRVVELVQSHNGVLWGEHGCGFRGEYAAAFFDETTREAMRAIKRAFDPRGIYNPGKLVATNSPLPAIDAVPRRADFDREIDPSLSKRYASALHCNGNGACFSRSVDETMCPSYQATGDRRQSPKGRAELLRTWIHDRSSSIDDPAFVEEIATSLRTCLSCKACRHRCPLEVDIPELKSQFLDEYYRTRHRPWRETMLARFESVAPWIARWGRLANALAPLPASREVVRALGLVDPPEFSVPSAAAELGRRNLPARSAAQLAARPDSYDVVLVPDTFTWCFDAPVLAAAVDTLRALGRTPAVLSPAASGKYEHVKGMRSRFEQQGRRVVESLRSVQGAGAPLLGLDIAFVQLFQDEYQVLGVELPRVSLFEEWLATHLQANPPQSQPMNPTEWPLLEHCMSRGESSRSARAWQSVFASVGHRATPIPVGCCGMAGIYGHQEDQLDRSRAIFDRSWRPTLEQRPQETWLVTGFSCREQVRRFSEYPVRHPLRVLSATLCPPTSPSDPYPSTPHENRPDTDSSLARLSKEK